MKVLLTIIAIMLLATCGEERQPDYRTGHGIRVFLGEINRPDQTTVESWTEETAGFWFLTFPDWQKSGCIDDTIRGVRATFMDDNVLIIEGRQVAGYAWYKEIAMAKQRNTAIDRGLFIHELSHVIVAYCGGFRDENESHKLFKEKGLGA